MIKYICKVVALNCEPTEKLLKEKTKDGISTCIGSVCGDVWWVALRRVNNETQKEIR